jgi:hypothetical protein
MTKKIILSVIFVFAVWSIMDYLIYHLFLGSGHQAAAGLWRPMAEVEMGLMVLVIFLASIIFVFLYAFFVTDHGLVSGFFFGFLYGIGAGLSMGYGTYAFMPIPYAMALTWFLGLVVQFSLAGLMVGGTFKKKKPKGLSL